MVNKIDEKTRQEDFPWQRSKFHTDYNSVLANYKFISCLEHARGQSLLDLACGDGLITSKFSPYFTRIVGVDASSTHIADARKRLPEAQFYECLIEEFETTERFDSIFLLDILEHVADPVFILKKSAAFLSEKGVIIIHVPNSQAINRCLAVIMGSLVSCDELSPFDLKIAGHRRTYNMESLKQDAYSAGLHVEASGGIFYKMLSTPQMDWFLKNGLWEEGGFGWGRVGMEKEKDWKAEFCRACYELGKERPNDCNIIYICATRVEVK